MKILVSSSSDVYGKSGHVDIASMVRSVRPFLKDHSKVKSASATQKALIFAIKELMKSSDPLAKLVVLETYKGDLFKFIVVSGTEFLYDNGEKLRKTQIFDMNNSVTYLIAGTKVEYYPYIAYPVKSVSALVEKD